MMSAAMPGSRTRIVAVAAQNLRGLANEGIAEIGLVGGRDERGDERQNAFPAEQGLIRALLIAGPTASGKSAVALSLAERWGATIVNADSMQVYRDLRVLTARPTPEEERRAPHRLFGAIDGAENFSVGRWLAHAPRRHGGRRRPRYFRRRHGALFQGPHGGPFRSARSARSGARGGARAKPRTGRRQNSTPNSPVAIR